MTKNDVGLEPMFIAGRQLGTAGGATEPVIGPAIGSEIMTVPLGTAADVDKAVNAVVAAFDGCADTSPGKRARCRLHPADRLDEHAEEFAQFESMSVGKLMSIARQEILFAASNLRFLARPTLVFEEWASAEYIPGRTSMIYRGRLGVVGSVGSWNFPLGMAVRKIAPALIAENTLMIKPSELTPLTTSRLAEFAVDFFSEGGLNVVTGHGETADAALIGHPRVGMSSLTGDVTTGKKMPEAAADSLKRVHLEFGTVSINEHLQVTWEIPHGRFKQSGRSNDMSIYSLEEYAEIKHVMVRLEEGRAVDRLPDRRAPIYPLAKNVEDRS